jgi:U3 small nucleolar RNA-associated protein 14
MHLQSLTLEEVRARQERLAKMRSLLFHHELKAKRLKAIKSKDYRKRMAKVCKATWLTLSTSMVDIKHQYG